MPRPAARSPWATEVLRRLDESFTAAADASRAESMAAYMQGQFAFLGITTPQRRALQRDALAGLDRPTADDLLALAAGAWALPEREHQYAACDALRRHAASLRPEDLPALRHLVTTLPWWDTVDVLAVHVVGALVRAHRHLQAEMDLWADEPDQWLVRTALLHQLMWKADTDAERLFRYCAARAADPRFFVRKAIGWALRQHARTDPDAVWAFVDAHRAELSGLSAREAEKHR
jgi:3-methyladenine DNA glycosylase AlkD